MAYESLPLVFTGVCFVAILIYMYLSISKYRASYNSLENRDYASQVILPSQILLLFIGMSYALILYNSTDEVKMNNIIIVTSGGGILVSILAGYLCCLRIRFRAND